MGLGVVIECEDSNLTEDEGWSKEGRAGDPDKQGKNERSRRADWTNRGDAITKHKAR